MGRARLSSPPMPTTVPHEIFKAYDIRGLYGEQIDGDVAEQVGRAFARVLARPARQGRRATLRIGLGRDMRLTAPELAARYRDGMVAEGAHVLDAGMVGTEMLYFLVGSRELDGGLMCTASHNPKAYTGAKLVREGALALSGDAGIGDIRALVLGGLPDAGRPRRARVEEVDVGPAFRERALSFIDPAAIRPLKVVLDGGNGMAGPDGRADPRAARRARAGPDVLGAGRRVPRPRAEPAAAREPPLRDRQGPQPRAPTSGSPGTATPTAASSSTATATSSTATSSRALLARSVLEAHPGADILYDVRASRAVPDTVRAAGGTAARQPRRPRVLQDAACATRAARSAARSPATTTSPTSTTPTRARCRRCSSSSCSAGPAGRSRSCSSRTARATSSPARSTRRSPTRRPGSRRCARATPTPRSPSSTGSRSTTTTGTSTCAPSNTEPLLRLCLESLVSAEDMAAKRDEVLGLIRAPA